MVLINIGRPIVCVFRSVSTALEKFSCTRKTHLFSFRKRVLQQSQIMSIQQPTRNQQQQVVTPNSNRRRLAVFDFDYTVVAQNTDTVVRDLLAPDKLPKTLDQIIDTAGWTQYMSEIFQLLHQQNFSPGQIQNAVRCIPEVPGFVRLIKWLKQTKNFDLIIISDSNSVFIAEWLQAHGLGNCFVSTFTNPAQFETGGLLTIKPYHHQTDCEISSANLCKGKVMEHFLVEQDLRYNIRYDCIVYVGDGNNDICPILRLRPGNFACAREGYALDRNIRKNHEKLKLRAEVIIWKNGFDLLHQLEAKFADDNTTTPTTELDRGVK